MRSARVNGLEPKVRTGQDRHTHPLGNKTRVSEWNPNWELTSPTFLYTLISLHSSRECYRVKWLGWEGWARDWSVVLKKFWDTWVWLWSKKRRSCMRGVHGELLCWGALPRWDLAQTLVRCYSTQLTLGACIKLWIFTGHKGTLIPFSFFSFLSQMPMCAKPTFGNVLKVDK